MTNEVKKTNDKFFSIHLVSALYEMENSIVRANIENTIEKIKVALQFYPTDAFYYEFHNSKVNMDWIIKNY